MSSKLIKAYDRLSEAEDFCQAIFMAAAGLEDAEDSSVFQRLAEVAKDKIREAMSIISEVREGQE
ncbi:hypothetical protein CO661_12065 [Sinorhizobium fredii]|uniref:Uncharacterized protein n=1 Tax=Rhizobium fredii TaxID=380 RepID=A0A2A6LZA1_RHIFR|nr:hypothetical protein [Sinorhizobium fredii]PDT47469.1 hypothetical protein CO661_12065 [Sinorhizobium fredii]